MCRLLAALRLSTHTEHVLPPHLAARFHKLPVCRGDGGESSPIRAFSPQVQPVIAIGNACEATDASLTTKQVGQRRCPQNANLGRRARQGVNRRRAQLRRAPRRVRAMPLISTALNGRASSNTIDACVGRGGRLKPPAGTL